MNLADIIVLAVVAAAVLGALRVHRKAGACACSVVTAMRSDGSTGGCSGGCSGCPHAAKCAAGRK